MGRKTKIYSAPPSLDAYSKQARCIKTASCPEGFLWSIYPRPQTSARDAKNLGFVKNPAKPLSCSVLPSERVGFEDGARWRQDCVFEVEGLMIRAASVFGILLVLATAAVSQQAEDKRQRHQGLTRAERLARTANQPATNEPSPTFTANPPAQASQPAPGVAPSSVAAPP